MRAKPSPEVQALGDRWVRGAITTDELKAAAQQPAAGLARRHVGGGATGHDGAAGDHYVDPGTNVLRNRVGLRDAGTIERRERDASYAPLLQLAAAPLPRRYDLARLQAFHRHIFGDVWPCAGELRTVAIAKDETTFTLPSTSRRTSSQHA